MVTVWVDSIGNGTRLLDDVGEKVEDVGPVDEGEQEEEDAEVELFGGQEVLGLLSELQVHQEDGHVDNAEMK